MKKLNEIGLQTNSDKSSSLHNYLNIYESMFESIRLLNNNILEIGILFGDSLKIWSQFFENSNIYSFDIEDKSYLQIPRCKILQGDQKNRNFLNSLGNINYDIILDDGCHKMEHQQISFGSLFKFLKSGGFYVIEDLHTSNPDYIETMTHGYGLFGLSEDLQNSTLNFLNNLMTPKPVNYYLSDDELNYLKSNIKDIKIFTTAKRNSNDMSITSVITKK